jgi:hypothetical protein
VQATTAIGDGAVAVDWDTAEAADEGPETLKNAPAGSEASYRALPGAALQPKSYAAWTRDFEQWLQRAQALRVFLAPSLGLASTPGESERDFRIRLQQSSREDRDAEVQKLRARYAPKVERLANKVRTAQEAVSREQSQAQQQNLQSVVSIGATVLGALMGRKMVSMSTLGRATTAARGMSRSMKESQDISRASEKLDEAKRELDELQKEVEDAVAELTAKTGDVTIETVELKPKRGSVDVRLVTLAWKGE